MREKIFNDISWKGKPIVCTWHFYQEWEQLHKPFDFVLEILEHGEHILTSKRQHKYNCLYPWHGKLLCIAYVETEEYILIHIKPTSR